MKRELKILFIAAFVMISSITSFAQVQPAMKKMETNKKEVKKDLVKDPFNVVTHTLKNGLKVYMAINKDEPRVQTMIAVRTGSKNDPPEVTGLAHYLEHMLFKGTSKMASLDWEKEKPLLQKISDKYEEYRFEKDEVKRKEIYKEIDKLSNEAAKYVATNEYDKLVASLGAKGTNAYTSNERTVYINDIPSNELNKWMAIESERFSELVLRLFHTELEAVYEEFNRGQDSDYRKAHEALMSGLFKKHTYGTQSTIGLGEHLKRPSMVKIHEYFDKYYVPNNMAIILAGDVNPDIVIPMIEKYFGGYSPKPVTQFSCAPEDPITTPIIKDVYGSDKEFVNIGFRLGGVNTKDRMFLELFDMMMSNGDAGLIDLDLTKKQLVLNARSSPNTLTDYSIYTMSGSPRDGQSLEDVKNLLLGEIEKVQKGDFEDWLIPAVVKQLKLQQIEASENNRWMASIISDAFIYDIPWEKEYHYYSEMSKITKEEVVNWAREKFGNNYVVVNKRIGDKDVFKVEKPEITEVPINRDAVSDFAKGIYEMESTRLKPEFIDFDKEIKRGKLKNDIPFSYVKNPKNDLFNLEYILDMGSFNDLEMALAIKYLEYLGTDKYTAEEFQKEMFKIGVSFGVYAADDNIYVYMSGLNESLKEGTELFEHLLSHAVADQKAYDLFIDGLIKERANNKLQKWRILYYGLTNYAKYGKDNPFTHIISNEDLKKLDPHKLVDKIKSLTNYKHQIYYYGPARYDLAKTVISKLHHSSANPMDYPPAKKFPELDTKENKVYFADYDMVQTELMMISKVHPFDKKEMAPTYVFNEFFGAGLSSIVFQEIRESRALAYSAYAYYTIPSKKDDSHYVQAYVGTQTDKLGKAADAMLELMSNMPEATKQFESSKKAALIKMETSRTKRKSIFWKAYSAKKKGLSKNPRPEIYEHIKTLTMADMKNFFNKNIANRKYTFLAISKKDDIDMDTLKKLGNLEILSLEQLFGY